MPTATARPAKQRPAKRPAAVEPRTASCVIDSPVGPLRLTASAAGLLRCDFAPGRRLEPPPRGAGAEGAILRDAARQLAEYFAGKRRAFDLPLALAGTPFQLSVWKALLGLAFGETACYGEIARRLGRPRASRAVGAACGANPIALIVPCHRVLGAGGGLTGFGGGLPAKEMLLLMESVGTRPR